MYIYIYIYIDIFLCLGKRDPFEEETFSMKIESQERPGAIRGRKSEG